MYYLLGGECNIVTGVDSYVGFYLFCGTKRPTGTTGTLNKNKDIMWTYIINSILYYIISCIQDIKGFYHVFMSVSFETSFMWDPIHGQHNLVLDSTDDTLCSPVYACW